MSQPIPLILILRQRLTQILKVSTIFYFVGIPIYALGCRYILPPLTPGQLESLLQHKTFHRTDVPLRKISRHVIIAVIAAEDGQFLNHGGFDWEAIKTAWASKQGGGSTISQQTAKNVFFPLNSNWLRKLLEIYPTIVIEKILGKERILETYLNVIEFDRGVWGIEAASQKYFGIPAAKLSRKQAARLIACLPDPKGCLQTRTDLANRQQKILKEMAYIEQLQVVRQFLNLDPDTP